ncbi:MAG: hypothetical protein MUC48_21685 [Leptolyngbya sp. Prado105]|jgi:hypothetical protein|nr:hypothetical protein [Leptolyngbya sp. Prado105]
MKTNLGDVLAVCLITFIVIAPALVVFALVWSHHLQFIHRPFPLARIAEVLSLMSMSGFFFFPVWTAYQSYQSAKFKQKVARLERLWQQSI